MCMDKDAINSYLLISRMSLDKGLIEEGLYKKRIEELKNEVENNSRQYVKNHLRILLRQIEFSARTRVAIIHKYKIRTRQSTYRNSITCFSPSIPSLNKWVFHKYDDDYFPSIPHGHWQGKKYPKLDAYLGFVYNKHHLIQKRVKRSEIISLWNNRKFRKFALESIEYYLKTHTHYDGWRVPNPRVIPRIR